MPYVDPQLRSEMTANQKAYRRILNMMTYTAICMISFIVVCKTYGVPAAWEIIHSTN